MRQSVDMDLFRRLTQALAELECLHVELADTVSNKIDAMKRADLVAMRDSTASEMALIRRIQERERERAKAAAEVANAVGLRRSNADRATVSQIGERLSEPQAGQLRSAADSLGKSVNHLSRVNRVAGELARGVLAHVRGVFESVATAMDNVEYQRTGSRAAQCGGRIFEAMG